MLNLPATVAALAMLLIAAWGPAAHAQAPPAPPAPNVQADLQSTRAAIAPGEHFTIALRQRIREGWHTYWRNPGDSGQPTRLTWHLPQGWRAGPIQWPAPTAMRFATLMSYVHSGEVLFPIEITAPRGLRPGETVTLSAEGDWLVCSDICIPEHATLALTLRIAAQGRDDPHWAPAIAQAVASLPPRADVQARITAGEPAVLSIGLVDAQNIRDPYFFPYSQDAINHAAPEQPRVGAGGLSFRLVQGVDHDLGAAPLAGVVTYVAANGQRQAIEIEAAPGAPLPGTDIAPAQGAGGAVESSPPTAPPAPADAATLATAIVFAFLGGLILNLMPCVLPVLSMKALSLAGGAHNGRARRDGAFYFVGVLVSFLALAVILIALREGGATVGWGFQLQAAWMTASLALLFFAIGLNLLDVFNIGGAQGAGASLAARGGDAGAFFTGALAVVAATPCTAPFMAGAVGLALTQSAPVALAIFAALGVGFALPLTALSFAPALQRLLPKPGVWMERVRNVLAFPMFAAAAWLAWVLAQQTGAGGVLALLGVATALAFTLFVARWSRIWLIVGAVILAATLVLAWKPLTETPSAATAQSWSAARVAELRTQGRPVFVNFTAAWCITCKVNEASTLASPRVRQAMQARGVAYLEGDWTNRDDAIAAELAAHGRAGVPLYLYYPPGGDAVVLPQILSEDIVLRAIGG